MLRKKVQNKGLVLASIFLLLSVSTPAYAASEGPNEAAASGDCVERDYSGGTLSWTNPDRAYRSDDSRAQAGFLGLSTTEYIECTNFGFSIPAGATIDGIDVEVERANSDGGGIVTDASVRLVDELGNIVGDDKATGSTWPVSEAYESHGGSTDDWNAGLSASDINDADFGAVFAGVKSTHTAPTVGTVDHMRITVWYTEADASLSQTSYRWFVNEDAVTVGAAAGLNNPVTLPTQGNPIRLRILLHATGSDIGVSGTTTKLQVAERSGACDTGFSGESYADVATASGDIRYYNNSTPADGDNLTTNDNDPRHSDGGASDTVIAQDYEESNNFTNSVAAIAVGEDGLWDFSLYDFSAPAGTSYCFRAVQSGGGDLDGGYEVIPEARTSQETSVRLRGNVRLRVVRLR